MPNHPSRLASLEFFYFFIFFKDLSPFENWIRLINSQTIRQVAPEGQARLVL
jgi:hypothetical protein